MIDKRLYSIDLETSSSDYNNGVILSIGAVHLESKEEFYSEIGYKGPIPIDASSSDIHKLDLSAEAMKERSSLKEVDAEFMKWLQDTSGTKKSWKLIGAGWNYGTFDQPFIKKYMPRSGLMLSRRSMDLNAVSFAFDVATGSGLGTHKKKSKKFAANPDKHNALADAWETVRVLEYFESLTKTESKHEN